MQQALAIALQGLSSVHRPRSNLSDALSRPTQRDEVEERFLASEKNSREFYSLRRKLMSKEHKVRLILERLFYPARFISTRRIPWLKNPTTGRALELDCFCAELMLAVEVDGVQHQQAVAHMGGEAAFRSQRERDHLKSRLCAENGVTLIRVPHWLNESKVESWLIREIVRRG